MTLFAYPTEAAADAQVERLRANGMRAAAVSLAEVHILVDAGEDSFICVGETDPKSALTLEALLDDREALLLMSQIAFAKEQLAETVWVGELVMHANDLDVVAKANGEMNSDSWEATRWSAPTKRWPG